MSSVTPGVLANFYQYVWWMYWLEMWRDIGLAANGKHFRQLKLSDLKKSDTWRTGGFHY